jgi:hypothetical protein
MLQELAKLPSRRAPGTHTGRSPVAAIPQALASGATLCLAESLSSIGDPLGVPRRELLWDGASRLHENPLPAIYDALPPSAVPKSQGRQPATELAKLKRVIDS